MALLPGSDDQLTLSQTEFDGERFLSMKHSDSMIENNASLFSKNNDGDGSFHPEVTILAPFVLLGFGALLRHTTRTLPVPYTMQLLIIGSILGFLLRNDGWGNAFQESVMVLGNMDPHLMLHIFLPPLIFEVSFILYITQNGLKGFTCFE